MQLSPREKDKLLLFTAALLAERRLARGLRLNYPETVAYLSLHIMEGARDGCSVAELMNSGRNLLTEDQVMHGVVELLPDIQVEATFPDGTKLVTVHEPILPAAHKAVLDTGDITDSVGNKPGEVHAGGEPIELNAGRERVTLEVANTGDRPIQVGSHYHFFETNPALTFDRDKARGFRLDIAAGTAVRFEPGQLRTVELVAMAGLRRVFGFNGKVMGRLDSGEA